MKIGVLHPGAMGETIVACLAQNAHELYWCSKGRSSATARRAELAGATGLATLDELVELCELIVSVCPPIAARAQAAAVSAAGYAGVYLDANAISPQTAAAIADLFEGRYIDGGIIGPPAKVAGTTRLYVSGPGAVDVVGLFGRGALESRLVDARLNSASALKMCYAAYTKGSIALLLATRALAESEGVGDVLESEWEQSQPGLNQRLLGSAAGVSPKAWRFVDEMHEIAQTFAARDLPADFHLGAAATYARLHRFKDDPTKQLSEVLAELLNPPAV